MIGPYLDIIIPCNLLSSKSFDSTVTCYFSILNVITDNLTFQNNHSCHFNQPGVKVCYLSINQS